MVDGTSVPSVTSSWAINVPTIWTDRSTSRPSTFATLTVTFRSPGAAVADRVPGCSREQPGPANSAAHITTPHSCRHRPTHASFRMWTRKARSTDV